jgi:hypothetical protein
MAVTNAGEVAYQRPLKRMYNTTRTRRSSLIMTNYAKVAFNDRGSAASFPVEPRSDRECHCHLDESNG